MRKRSKGDLLSTVAIIVGILILLYPTISNFLVERNASRAVSNYDAAVSNLTDERYAQMLAEAHAYNAQLAGLSGIPAAEGGADPGTVDAAGMRASYMQLLNLSGDGMMGYITIPRLDETMPIYHTTEEKVLQVATGHIETSSLPVGGASTHAAISGHRGLPSAKLFTELDKMQLGDIFYVKVLKETFAYQVDQILTVLPEETEALAIEPRADYMTLVTCTPYAINSHRLLVRAHAIPYLPSMEGEVGVMGNPINLSWPHLALIAALILLAVVFAGMRLRQLERRDKDEFLEERGRAYTVSGKEEGHEHAGRHFK
ncbi:MAG: class C sortase [Collinsella intestinalis]